MSALDYRGAPAVNAVTGAPRAAQRDDAGRALFGHAARLLAAAKALEASAQASGTAPAVGATLACVEASLGALAAASESLRDEELQSRPGSLGERRLQRRRRQVIRRFDDLADALDETRAACAAARAPGDHEAPAFEEAGV